MKDGVLEQPSAAVPIHASQYRLPNHHKCQSKKRKEQSDRDKEGNASQQPKQVVARARRKGSGQLVADDCVGSDGNVWKPSDPEGIQRD